jgi:hypothetical protein
LLELINRGDVQKLDWVVFGQTPTSPVRVSS